MLPMLAVAYILTGPASSALLAARIEIAVRQKDPKRLQLSKYEGTLRSVSTDGIVLSALGEKGVRYVSLCPQLRAGKWVRGIAESEAYRTSDVIPNDYVALTTFKEGKLEVCVGICIYKRPMNLVPPSPVTDPQRKKRYHDFMNEFHAEKDFGIKPKK